jgi:hypothetical protein
VKHRQKDEIEVHIGSLLGTNPTVPVLRVIVDMACEMANIHFEGAQVLARSKRDEILAWLKKEWGTIRWAVERVANDQRIIHLSRE